MEELGELKQEVKSESTNSLSNNPLKLEVWAGKFDSEPH